MASEEFKPNILIVDDSRVIRTIIKKALSSLTVGNLLEAENGLEAINTLSLEPVDLVITDIDMPKMNGLELVEAMRKIDSLSNIPVLMITANASPQNVIRSARLMVSDILAKPVTPEIVKEKVEALLFGSKKVDPSLSVLIVDDLQSARKVMSKMLGDLGLQHTDTAKNGAEALEKILAKRPQIVILDLELPDMNGYELIQKIKSPGNGTTSQVILITSKLDKDSVLQAAKSGANALLPKPFDLKMLESKIIQCK